MLKRILCLCMAVCFLFLYSCAVKNPSANEQTEGIAGDTTEAPVETENIVSDDLLDDLNFGGAEFNILGRTHIRSNDDFTVDGILVEPT